MNASPANPSLPAPAASATHRRPSPVLLRALALAVALCSVALAWAGGWAGATGAALACLGLPWLLRQPGLGAAAGAAGDDEPRVSGGRVGAEVMVSQVVPVWSSQLDITRDAAADGLGKLLNSFSEMSGALNTLGNSLNSFTPTVEAGAVDGALAAQSPALAALLGPSRRAFDQRDAMAAELIACSNQLDDLRQLGRLAREIGKHTRLVAFNASIEANRGGGGGQGRENGAHAVADETRALASRMAEVGERIDRVVGKLDKSLSAQRMRAEIDDTTPDELQMELDLRAREALGGLLAAMSGAMHNSGEVKAASDALQEHVDALFTHFQFGDRLSQMLSIVGNDMQNFARWVAANPYATQSDAAQWLANLEASYTMEEQRSQHHGTVHVDTGTEIEFF